MIVLLALACSDKAGETGVDSGLPVETATPDTDAPDSASDSASDTARDSGGDTATGSTWYRDADGDGFGDPHDALVAVQAPSSYVADATDCDDTDGTVHPGADEPCDGIDQDCDGGEEGAVSLDDGTVHASVQDAVDAATPGATVSVCEGTYEEQVVVRTNLTLQGVDAALVTLDAGDPLPAGSTVVIDRNVSATLAGLTITGGTGTNNDGGTWGGGVYAGQSAGVTIQDCVIEGNSASFGGGLVGTGLYPSQDVLIDTVVRDNVATEGAGGFVLFHASLTGVEVSGNSAAYGGGASAWYWEVAADATTVVEDNTATVGGGLLIFDEGTWSGGTIQANVASEQGGGAYVMGDGILADTAFSDNQAADGGAVAMEDGRLGLDGVVADGNTADDRGGAFFFTDGSQVDATDLTFTSNTATTGGGLFLATSGMGCSSCDGGDGKTDNSPDDLYVDVPGGGLSIPVGSSASFECDPAGCTVE